MEAGSLMTAGRIRIVCITRGIDEQAFGDMLNILPRSIHLADRLPKTQRHHGIGDGRLVTKHLRVDRE